MTREGSKGHVYSLCNVAMARAVSLRQVVAREADAKAAHGAADTHVINAAGQGA